MARFKKGRLIESVHTEILSADKTLQILVDSEIQSLDPNGENKSVILSDESASEGYSFKIFNAGTIGNLLIRDSLNSITITTLLPNTMGLFLCNGSSWKGTSGTGSSSSSIGDADTGDIESLITFHSMGGF